jgi:hypothetical protein
MKPTPTDLELLNAIHDRYYDAFASYDPQHPSRDSKNYIPIDIKEIAKQFGVDSDIVFGRLYYHLEQKYGYRLDDNSHVHFFAPRIGKDIHCVHFSYLSSVLADLRDENRKYRLATTIAIISLFLSVISFGISVFV